jgi:beta-galactosidase
VLGQGQLCVHQPETRQPETRRPEPRARRRPALSVRDDGALALGPAVVEPVHGRLIQLGGLALDGPRLDVWRAPIDNERFGPDPLEARWRQIGLHRMTHRLIDIRAEDDELVVRTRVAPAALDLGLLTTYRWSAGHDADHADHADQNMVNVTVTVEPQGTWTVPLPRLGTRMSLPARLERMEWFGAGPGESYPDSAIAARIGRFSAGIDDLQTPYVFPQENGNRSGVRWAELSGPDGPGLRIAGYPTVDVTARRWTSEDLDRARHTSELRPRSAVFVNVDAGEQGLGSAACGQGVLPPYVLPAQATEFSFSLRVLGT